MKKFLALALVATLSLSLMTACGKNGDGIGGTPEPTPTPKVWHQNPLTGEEQSFDYPYGQRPVGVMVNNIMSGDSYQSAWPQSGLSQADTLFEMETEGGITRYLAIFRDYTKMPVVGPIRSARDQFVQMMFPLSCLYVHDGGSTYAKDMLKTYEYEDRDLTPNKGVSFRDKTEYNNGLKAYEHTEFVSGQLITKAVENEKNEINSQEEPANMFDWVKYDEPKRVLDGVDASTIEWRFSNSYASKISYNAENGKYTKDHINLNSRFSKPLIDAGNGGIKVEFDNVFVLWTQIERYPDGVLSNVDLRWGGVGYYFNGGKVEKVRWFKGLPHEPLRITSMDGTETPIKVNTGKSYIAMVDVDYFGTYAIDGVLVDVAGDYKPVAELPVDEGTEAKDE
ncbi:MAG: DUF3048 domain-containing protein [Oscillospiraceae bacterium]